ncbi:smoothened homolog [Octopus vulgaris]|uniref:Smoothened homolog n=1 Tax=Octopus vulgaris TaxID=6645 RepID=A0AA36BSQ9_OCTVU|nr:smoothened homolog [Octopus vulgaris]
MMNGLIVFEVILLSCVVVSLMTPTSVPPDCTFRVDACEPLKSNVCLGAQVDFTHTSTIFLRNGDNDSSTVTQEEIQQKLQLWKGLQNFHKCWSVVQHLLCSVYVPKCDPNTSKVEYPSREWCQSAEKQCRIVETFNKNQGWPSFLRCQANHFKESCKNTGYQKVTFNSTGVCSWPLINTNNSATWYGDIEGCGLQCKNPLYTDRQHNQVHVFIAVLGTLSLLSSLFTVLTFLIDWKNASRYPALILFFINICFVMGSIGWLAQFAGNAREDIVCNADKTVRIGEPQPGSGESASCSIIFLLIYYFTMAGVVWFVMLSYAWHTTFKALGTPRDILSGKTAYFHIISWCVPLVLSITCLASSEIDGDYISGICFVGYVNRGVRAGFVLVPIAIVLILGLNFMVRSLCTLISVKKETPDFIGDKATAKIQETIIRIGMFSGLAVLFVCVTFAVHTYIFVWEEDWRKNLKNYVMCKVEATVTNMTTSVCDSLFENKLSLVATEIHIFSFFGAGIVMSSWSWNKASLSAWERFLRKVFRKPSSRTVKLKRHKMIAKAFAKRKEINSGRFSISFYSTHDDPLGMKFDLNSVSSGDVSSEFAANMPKLVRRRGGMFQPMAGTLRRYSDSDVASVTSRIFSMENSDGEKIDDGNDQKLKKKKKKKKRFSNNRVKPQLTPLVLAMQKGAQEFLRSSKRHKRRGSDTSGISRASAQSIHFSLDRNSSADALSISSMKPNSELNIHKIHKTETKSKRVTNFAIFTANSLLPGSVQDNDGPQGTNLAMGDMTAGHSSCTQCGAQSVFPPEIAIFNIEDETSSTTSSSC